MSEKIYARECVLSDLHDLKEYKRCFININNKFGEKDGLLLSLLESKFAHSKFLYESIIEQGMQSEFKDYIYSLLAPRSVVLDIGKSV